MNSPLENFIYFSNNPFLRVRAWTNDSAWLLLQNQLHWAVVRSQYRIMDNHILDAVYQRLRDQKIVNPPADAALTGIKDIRPPGVLDLFGIQFTVNIHKAVVEKFLHPL